MDLLLHRELTDTTAEQSGIHHCCSEWCGGHHRDLLPLLHCTVQRQGHFWEQVGHASHVKTLGGQLERLPFCLTAVSVVSVMHRCVCSSLHSCRAGRSLPAPGSQLQLLAFPMQLKLALPTTALKNVLCSSTLNHCFLFASSHSHPCQSKAPQLQFLL